MKKIFVFGSSHFIDKNIEKETPKSGEADIEIYFGDEMNKADFYAFANTVSLFGNDKYAVIRNAAKISDINEFILNLGKITETSIIASAELSASKSDGKTAKAFKEAGFEIREESSYNKASNMDVLKIFKEKNMQLSAVNAGYILNVSGGDMNAVENEAEKLSLYLETNKNLKADDIIKYIAGEKEEKIYMVVSHFAKKNTKECLEIYKSVPKTYENNMFLFFSIAKFVYNLYFYYVDPSIPDIKTQFQKNLMENKRLWTREETANIIGHMARLDFDVKTGRKIFENAIEDAILFASPTIAK